ncbi:MAG: hypothetical protein WAS07_01975 [Micropruina sp.]|nr:hypothetical protein [Micropruina sp.]
MLVRRFAVVGRGTRVLSDAGEVLSDAVQVLSVVVVVLSVWRDLLTSPQGRSAG